MKRDSKFEEWYWDNFGQFEDDGILECFSIEEGAYYQLGTRMAYAAWKASRQALEIALRVLEQQGGWISCGEGMPALGSTILVHMEDPIHSATAYAVATYDKYGFSRSRVTHWQPLSPPPQPSTNPQIDNDGWIEWHGGDCPVDYGVLVEFVMRDGDTDKVISDVLDWTHENRRDDIIAYRVIENDGREG